MSTGAIVLMVITLLFVTSSFIFFIIMDLKDHKKKHKQNKQNEVEKKDNISND